MCELEVYKHYLELGYKLKKHRFKTKYSEIDLVFENNEKHIFVEVKSLNHDDYAQTRLGFEQKKRIERTLKYYLSIAPKDLEYHYAIVSQKDGVTVFEHFLD